MNFGHFRPGPKLTPPAPKILRPRKHGRFTKKNHFFQINCVVNPFCVVINVIIKVQIEGGHSPIHIQAFRTHQASIRLRTDEDCD